ncbi:MAG: aldo/keto reductase [Acidobacteriaceae bacterium]|nr:aldo/keto reductase [Acidobacteriaceae bacterium]
MSYLGKEIKKLGFGMMRLPRRGDNIDIEQVKQMVDRFLDAGFTYFDTAWAYVGSEDAIRQALVERYPRDSFQLATKVAAWIKCNSRDDAIGQFEASLRETGAGYFDFYLLHNLGEGRTRFFDDFRMWDFVQEKKQQGLIKHIGFSFHSTPEELDAILDTHPEMEFVQLQINWADWDNPAIQSRANYEVARKHGKPVIVMEPVKGGVLANPPETVAEIFRKQNPDTSSAASNAASNASWAIRFAASLEGIVTVLSGMSNLEQMEDNLSYMRHFTPLSEAEKLALGEAQSALNSIPLIPCTTCDYCAKVCPNDIGISGSFTAMNHLTLYRNEAAALQQEKMLVANRGKKRASECIQCRECEQVCPQHIVIAEELARVDNVLGRIQASGGNYFKL